LNHGHHAYLWKYYQALIRLRKIFLQKNYFKRENIQINTPQENLLVVEYTHSSQGVIQCMNFSNQQLEHTLPEHNSIQWNLLIDSADSQWFGPDSDKPNTFKTTNSVRLCARSIMVFDRKVL
ncbi:MAG: hypothetical protein KC713_08570, partial [Candidatus Omnitrophica bacterium]|nr:hypothetical protein [Candidatus Omnitrophota bacterium]